MKAYRMNISLPQSLRKRMEAVVPQPNWSAIAAAAFDRYMREQPLDFESWPMWKLSTGEDLSSNCK